MEAPLMIIGTTLIALGQLVRVRGHRAREPRQSGLDHHGVAPADERAVADPSPRAHVFHTSLLMVSSLAVVSLAVLFYAVAGQGGPRPEDASMRAGATQGPEHHSDRYREQLKLTQEALRSLGYTPGAIDGMMGLETSSALRAFQQRQGLSVTGRLNPETRAALGTEDRLSRRAP